MTPDKNPGHGEKPKSPERKPEPIVKPEPKKQPGMPGGQAKPSSPDKR